ncbi:MAG: nucleotidyl transferase AbiEii/AbiGii toxin family protein [Aestuariivita sp.]|nr:nucleotidyl transferase AbiEii/AbiGii toxin family protein [Aestuariivita sp.]
MNDDATHQWQVLLKLARKRLETIGLSLTDWIWGGSTVLMLGYHHRLSRDIDLFLNNPQYLTPLLPRLNERVAATDNHYIK